MRQMQKETAEASVSDGVAAVINGPVSGLALLSADLPPREPDPTFWTRRSGAPADLVRRLEQAAGRQIALSGDELVSWTEDVHVTFALLTINASRRRSEKSNIYKDENIPPKAKKLGGSFDKKTRGEQIQLMLREADTMFRHLMSFKTFEDAALRRATWDAARALVAFQLAAKATLPAISYPGARPLTWRLHLVAHQLELYKSGFRVEPGRSRGGPAARFVQAMFAAAGAGRLSDSAVYNLMGQTRNLPSRKG